MNEEIKTNAIRKIEAKMDGIDGDSMRTFLLQSAKEFKTSWVELGRALFAVKKDKLFYEWGFENFEVYVVREISIRKQTALKLIKSYEFLEKEESWYLDKNKRDEESPVTMPSYEAVNVLRTAKNKKEIESDDYNKLKEAVFTEGKDHREVRKDLTSMIKQREEIDPQDARMRERLKVIKRFVSTLKSTQEQLELLKMLPKEVIDDVSKLITKVEEYV